MRPRLVLLALLLNVLCDFPKLSAQARNANWLSQCWLSFSTAGVQHDQLPPNIDNCRLAFSNENAQLHLSVSGDFSGTSYGIRDGNFGLIENHPPMNPWIFNISGESALFMPVPNHPDRTFLFFHQYFEPQIRKYGWLEIRPDGPGNQLRMTDIGLQYFMLNPAIKCTGIAHANGVDYWFITQAVGTNEVHAFRIGENGVEEGPIISSGGLSITDQLRLGFMTASVQGDRFVSQAWDLSSADSPVFELFDFDPNTGVASLVHTFFGLTGLTWGAEFGPSGRYLYLLRQEFIGAGHLHHLYQYDLDAVDIEASRIVVDSHDTSIGGLEGAANNMSLAPDGRIYINRYLHASYGLILQPDEAAPNCGYVENALVDSNCYIVVPHPIHYYHDDAPLGVTAVERPALRVWPNPVNEQGVVSGVGDGQIRLRWCDALGRVIQEATSLAQNGRVSLDVQALPSGAYVLNVLPKNGMPASVRVSVMH